VDINSERVEPTADLEQRCPDGPPGPRGRRRVAVGGLLVLAAVALGLALAGCGSSATGTNPSPSGSASGGSYAEKLVAFAQCMRQNGVPSFPDPVDGRLNLVATPDSPLNPNNPLFQSARDKCKALEPPGALGGAQNAQQQEQMLKFVNCMRSNGVPNFPDPQQNGGIMMTGGPNQIDPNSPAFQKAMQTCRNLLPGGGAVGGGQ
jgi:hypothetical protein